MDGWTRWPPSSLLQLFGVIRHNKTLYGPADRERPARETLLLYINDVYWLLGAAARFTCPVIRARPINAYYGRERERPEARCAPSAAAADSSRQRRAFRDYIRCRRAIADCYIIIGISYHIGTTDVRVVLGGDGVLRDVGHGGVDPPPTGLGWFSPVYHETFEYISRVKSSSSFG